MTAPCARGWGNGACGRRGGWYLCHDCLGDRSTPPTVTGPAGRGSAASVLLAALDLIGAPGATDHDLARIVVENEALLRAAVRDLDGLDRGRALARSLGHPDCQLSDGAEPCPGYRRLYDAYLAAVAGSQGG